jgi:D-proline reductase (dithiol) PrdB
VPVLARWIEAEGISTVTVTMMPSVAEERLAPRIVGVEFPFGHPFGMPRDRGMQRRTLELALRVLSGATRFGTRVDVDIEWPVPVREAYRAWQPKEPSPIVKQLLDQRRAGGV